MTDHRREFREILEDFDTAMMITRARDGMFRARPMAIARTERDGDLWFLTSIETGKIDEILADPRCGAVMQSDRKQLSISGRAEIVRDRSKIDELWDESYRPWFEDGKNDPDLVAIHLIAEEAEYWDSSGLKGLRYAFEVAKALVRGESVDTSKLKDNNARVSL